MTRAASGRGKSPSSNGTRKNERFYLGGFEIYREYGGDASVTLERETLHVMDDKQRIALVETKTVDNGISIRYAYARATLSTRQSPGFGELGARRGGRTDFL